MGKLPAIASTHTSPIDCLARRHETTFNGPTFNVASRFTNLFGCIPRFTDSRSWLTWSWVYLRLFVAINRSSVYTPPWNPCSAYFTMCLPANAFEGNVLADFLP